MNDSARLPVFLRAFVDSEKWTFAKSMPEWPHEYLVRDRVDATHFGSLIRHILENGVERPFYERKFTYFAEDGWLYWTMGEPIEKTTIINRCREETSYENRLKNGTLPAPRQPLPAVEILFPSTESEKARAASLYATGCAASGYDRPEGSLLIRDDTEPGRYFSRKYWKITKESLSVLEESAAWKQSGLFERNGFTSTGIYGPRGSLSCFYGITWNTAESMKSDLCQNMGGGVPIEIIDELVRISERQ